MHYLKIEKARTSHWANVPSMYRFWTLPPTCPVTTWWVPPSSLAWATAVEPSLVFLPLVLAIFSDGRQIVPLQLPGWRPSRAPDLPSRPSGSVLQGPAGPAWPGHHINPSPLPGSYSVPGTPTSLLFLSSDECPPRALALAVPSIWKVLPPDVHRDNYLTSVTPLFKCHFLSKAFPH